VAVGLSGSLATSDVYVSGTTFTNEGRIAGRVFDQAGAVNGVSRGYGWEATTGG
jgi:hypothetical protein